MRATLQQSGVVRISDGDLRVEVYDAISVDHVLQYLWKQRLHAIRAGTPDTTPAVGFDIRRYLLEQ